MIVSKKILFVISITILVLLYIIIPFDLIVKLIGMMSFDGKIDPQNKPVISTLYHCFFFAVLFSMIIFYFIKKHVPTFLHTAHTWIKEITTTRFLFFTILMTVIIRLVMIFLLDNKQVSDFLEYHQFAKDILHGNGYIRNGEPTAWFPIGFPFFLSIIYRIFGENPLCGELVNVLLSTILILTAFYTAKNVFSVIVAKYTAIILALWPNICAYNLLLNSDLLFTSLFSILILLLVQKKYTFLNLFFMGLIFAAATLTRSTLALYFLMIFAAIYYKNKNRIHLIKSFCIFLLGSLLIFSPWWIRNYKVFDKFVPLSTNGGFNFWLANVQLPEGNNPSNESIKWSKDELSISKMGYRLGFQGIKSNPVQFIKQIPVKVINLFITDISGFKWIKKGMDEKYHPKIDLLIALSQIFYMLIMSIAVMAIFASIKTYPKFDNYMILLTLLYWIFFHLLFFGKDRYHLPLIPIFSIYASVFINQLFTKIKTTNKGN